MAAFTNTGALTAEKLSPGQLLAIRKELPNPVDTFYKNLLSKKQGFDSYEYIDIEKVKQNRPVIAPYSNTRKAGMPIHEAHKSAERYRPAQVKLSDEVPHKVRYLQGLSENESVLGLPTLSPDERVKARVAEILAQHRDAVLRRHNLHASRMLRYAKDTMNYATGETQTIELGRDSSLTTSAVWKAGTDNTSIQDSIQTLMDAAFKLPNHAAFTDMVVSPYLFSVMTQNKYFSEQHYQFTQPVITNTGINNVLRKSATLEPQNQGTLNVAGGMAMTVWVDGTSYLNEKGTMTRFAPDNEVFFFDRASADGTQCYAENEEALIGFSNQPIVHYDTGDKLDWANEASSRKILTYSSFLMLPVNTNGTALMTVTVSE